MGERPCGADATVFDFIASLLTPVFASKVRSATERHRNLTDYRDRILGQKLYRGWKNRRIGPNKKLFSLLTARCRRPYPHRRHGSCAGRLEFCVSTTHSD
jgi:hypothetical protein